MNKDQYDPESKKIFKGLITAVIVVEIVNIIMSVTSGVIQVDSCPVNSVPAFLSVLFSSVACFMTILIPFFAINKKLWTYYAVNTAIAIIVVGLFLAFGATGGISWCSYP
jgi:dolichyl-phosphate-mannose--protein O-mannosyl transferase